MSKSKRVGDDGTLADDISFRELKPGGGNSVYSKRVERYKSLDDCNVEGDIHTFRIK